jgi:CheY-like chemotaxis protein
MNNTSVESPGCPYCGRPLRYVPNRWFGHSVFECEQCGDFPDFRSPIGAAAFEAAATAAAGARPHETPRVLLVDDSDEQRALYAAMLKPNATVVTASRGEHALALACADPPDVIVLDVLMPGMDGWETCERLKSESTTADIPIIMLTSLDGVDVPARARAAGAIAVLMKPCPPERLVLTINAARRQDNGLGAA